VPLDERWRRVRRVVAMRLDNIGDVIMTGPALRAVRDTLPHAHLTLLASPSGQAAARLLPGIDQVLPWRSVWQDLGHLAFDPAREFGFIQILQALRFDAAIIFTSFSQTPHVAAYACYLAGIPLRLGEPKDFGGSVLTDTPPSPSPFETHQAERNLRLVESVGFRAQARSLAVQIPPEAHCRARELLAQAGLGEGTSYVVLSPWASCQARTYPRFGAVGRLLEKASGLPLVVTGSLTASDRPSLIAEIGPRAIDLVGQTTVADLAALIAGASLVLTNNTATMHLADACRIPQVVLYSGTDLEEQWAPRDGPARLLRRPTACHPCYRFTCPHNLECLDIEPEEVTACALDMLCNPTTPKPSLIVEA